jgi:mono/diheme cytochrome c family protein
LSRRRARLVLAAAVLVAAAAVALWALSAPERISAAAIPAHRPDLANGRRLYHAGSCGTCHAAADTAKTDLPIGGAPFPTPVGIFYPGNLTPDRETGIGAWTERDFVDAMAKGVSPDGRHYFPSFPYTSFRRMRVEDLLDLRGYLMSLPSTRSEPRAATLPLLPIARRGVGLWKRVAARVDDAPLEDGARSAAWNRGAYLSNTIGHCGECHTPRDLLMVPDPSRHFAGGAHPAGEGKVPSLRGLLARKRYEDAADLTAALQFGETYGYDKLSSGGMGKIQENLARLADEDVQAIAEYLVSLR